MTSLSRLIVDNLQYLMLRTRSPSRQLLSIQTSLYYTSMSTSMMALAMGWCYSTGIKE